ncbi:MAG: response regulator transcription factor [Bdellovibrionota bacterium]
MKRILSVDDSRAVHAYLDDCLRGTAFQLMHVMAADQALELLGHETFDLILLDWEMPGLSGPEFFDAARKAGCSTPIVMITSKNRPEEIASMIRKGAAEYVMKPFTPDILLEKIEMCLGG